MEKNKNYKIIMIANRIQLYSIIFFAPCVWVGILSMKAGEIYPLSYVFIFIFVDIAVYCLMTCWINRIIRGKCDFLAHEKAILSLLNQKRYKENLSLHIDLLIDSLILGKYDESRQKIDELRQLDSRLKPVQKLNVQLCYIDYMIAINETASLTMKLDNAENALLMLSGKSNRIKQKFQRSIRLRRYLIEELWEDLLELLKKSYNKDMTIYEQVNTAYYCGECCYHLGRYEEAFSELKFAAEYGGNTKYVTLANELIEKIPEKNLYESKSVGQSKKVKHSIDKTVIIFAISCLLLILSIAFNRYCSRGNSIEEAYCRRYFCSQDELTIIYQNKIDNYELVIICDGVYEAYCLFQEADSVYKMVESCRLERKQTELVGIEMTETEKDIYFGNQASGHIWMILVSFYQQNDIFYQEDIEYVGICFSPLAENVVVNGIPVSVEQVIYIDEVAFYLWSVENVDLKTNLQVEYIAE